MVAVACRRDNDQLIEQWQFYRVRGTPYIALSFKMAWLTLSLGLALVWAGVDALRSLSPPKYLSKREVSEAVWGEGAQPMSDAGESYVRTRMLVQGSSLAILIAIVFVVAGLAAVWSAVWMLLET